MTEREIVSTQTGEVVEADPLTVAIREELEQVQHFGAKTTLHVIKCGQLLNKKHTAMGVGRTRGVPPTWEWEHFLRDKLSLEVRTAQRFMQVARTFAPEPKIVEHLDLSAAYVLSKPSTPHWALDFANRKLKRGNRVTHAEALKLVRKHTPQAPYKPKARGQHSNQIPIAAPTPEATELLDTLERLVNVPRLQLSPIDIRHVVDRLREQAEAHTAPEEDNPDVPKFQSLLSDARSILNELIETTPDELRGMVAQVIGEYLEELKTPDALIKADWRSRVIEVSTILNELVGTIPAVNKPMLADALRDYITALQMPDAPVDANGDEGGGA